MRLDEAEFVIVPPAFSVKALNKQTLNLKLFGGTVFNKENISEVKFNREGAKHALAKALRPGGNSNLI